MKVILSPDSFKGSMTSLEASEQIKRAFLEVDPNIEIIPIPMADGGEGTVDAIMSVMQGEKIQTLAQDPLGREIPAVFGWNDEQKVAVIEMSSASGFTLLSKDELDPFKASTYGTGQLIRQALNLGAKQIILGLGGSATVDAGVGCLQALGVKFLDKNGCNVNGVGGELYLIDSVDVSGMDERLNYIEFIVASDVTNPLIGKTGAVYTFGPQKGLKAEELEVFEEGMKHFAEVTSNKFHKNLINYPGAGAAGGIGYTLNLFFNAQFRSGLELVLEISKFQSHLQDADLVVTGEGSLDDQSLFGKVPVGIARVAKANNVPVVAFAGKIQGNVDKLKDEGLTCVFPIVDEPMALETAMKSGPKLLYKSSKRFIETVYLSLALKKKD